MTVTVIGGLVYDIGKYFTKRFDRFITCSGEEGRDNKESHRLVC